MNRKLVTVFDGFQVLNFRFHPRRQSIRIALKNAFFHLLWGKGTLWEFFS